MYVVLGHESTAVVEVLASRSFTAINVNSDAEMLDSIKAGLAAAQSCPDTNAVLVLPVDHPAVSQSTISLLLESFTDRPESAVMPEYRGKGGHPVLIPRSLWPEILSYAGDGGLRQFWLDNPRHAVRIAVDDPGSVLDLDTPAGYVRAIER